MTITSVPNGSASNVHPSLGRPRLLSSNMLLGASGSRDDRFFPAFPSVSRSASSTRLPNSGFFPAAPAAADAAEALPFGDEPPAPRTCPARARAQPLPRRQWRPLRRLLGQAAVGAGRGRRRRRVCCFLCRGRRAVVVGGRARSCMLAPRRREQKGQLGRGRLVVEGRRCRRRLLEVMPRAEGELRVWRGRSGDASS